MIQKQQIHNETSQAERRQVLRDTLHTRAIAEANTIGGRYGAISKSTVTGSGPVEYPRQPPSSPWATVQATEPPLGISVDEMAPVGEPFEVEKSLREASDGAGFSPPDAAASASPDEVLRPAEHTLATGCAPSSPSNPKRRKRR